MPSIPPESEAAMRDRAAGAMDTLASSLHDKAQTLPGGEKIVRAAQTAADTMEGAADYLRDQDLRAMLSDVQRLVKRHPGATLLVVAAVGFLLARNLTRH